MLGGLVYHVTSLSVRYSVIYGCVVHLKSVKGIAEGSNLPGHPSEIFKNFPFGVENLDGLGVGIVTGCEGLRDG